MLTNNFYGIQRLGISGAKTVSRANATSIYGVTATPMENGSTSVNVPTTPLGLSTNGTLIYLGSGNTTASVTDTDLISRFDDNVISRIDQNITQTWNNGQCQWLVSLTAKNISGNEITVNEVGVSRYYNTNALTHSFLIMRKVLTNSVIVPPNGVFAVSVIFSVSKTE